MKPDSWRQLSTRCDDASTCMAIDRRLLENLESQVTVRFYTWRRPSLSVGVNTPLSTEIRSRCEQRGIEVVARPTGGGAVLHDADITYCVAAPVPSDSVLETYRWVADGLVRGFRLLGLAADISEHPGRAQALACFALPTGADLQVQGRKICGSAQARSRGRFIQHGSIPISDVRSKTRDLLGASTDGSACLQDFLPGLTQSDAISAFLEGFIAAWGPPSVRDEDVETVMSLPVAML